MLYGMSVVGLLGLVRLDEEGKVIPDPYRTHPIQMEWRYERMRAEGLFDENAKKAAKMVEEGAVLLKNDGVLPLSPRALDGRIALIGLGAKYPVTGEMQERSFGTLRRMQSGQEALEEATGKTFAAYPGIDYVGETIPAQALFQDAAAEKPGLVRTWGIREEDRDPVAAAMGPGGAGAAFFGFQDFDEDGVLIDTGMTSYNDMGEKKLDPDLLGKFYGVDPTLDFTVGTDETGAPVKTYRNGPNGTAFTDQAAWTWKGFLRPEETGDYSLMLHCIGGMASFFIQTEEGWKQAGRALMREWAQWPWESLICTREGMGITGNTFRLEAGKTYPIQIHGRQCVKNKDLQIRLAWQTPSFRKKSYEAALEAASRADTIVYYACDQVMRELKLGFRKLAEEQPLEITGEQRRLLLDVIAAKKPDAKLIVLVQSSNARALGEWEAQANAILTAYHPGQEGARILAKILTGEINPSGKLSQTWPAATADTPLTDSAAHLRERGVGTGGEDNVMIRLSEGIFSGYRYYDREGVSPLYPFGHGLSYTTYAYDRLEISPEGGTYRVSFTVRNTGERAGDEIAQVYLGKGEVPVYMQMAEKQLIGFARVKNIQPGETRSVSILIDPKMLMSWDPARTLQLREDGTKDRWVRVTGEREIMVGASSRDLRLRGKVNITEA